MAVAPSAARTRPRSTALPRMQRATSPRIWWPPEWQKKWKCSWPTPSVSLNPFRSSWIPFGLLDTEIDEFVDSFGTGQMPDVELTAAVRGAFALTPRGMIEALDLLKPNYRPSAAYGHFGREDAGFGWEKLDHVAKLKASV